MSLDKILRKIKDAHLSVNDEKDRAKIEAVVGHIVAHEIGHNLGLSDNKVDRDLMNQNAPGFGDSIITGHLESDIDKAARNLDRRGQ